MTKVTSQREGGCGFKMRCKRILTPHSPKLMEMIRNKGKLTMLDSGQTEMAVSIRDEIPIPEQETMLQIVWRNFLRHPMGLAGLCVLLVIVLLSVFAFLSPYDPSALNAQSQYMHPSLEHLFGTDRYGRDILTRIAYGGRISLAVGILAMATATIIGMLIGGVAGYYSGTVDNVLMRFTDFFLSFPQLFVLLFLSFILRESNISFLQGGLGNIILVIGATSWMTVARLVRGAVLKLREMDFIRAARSYGARDVHIMLRHMLPNILGPIIVAATMGTAWAILTESGLSFLGYGIQEPTPSWGNMLQLARVTIGIYPEQTFFPGLMIFLTVISLNYVGDALRDAFDPHKFTGILRS
jgi:peptide/nickel transport system permease protein